MPQSDTEREVFEACLELSPTERSSYLLEVCRGRPEMEKRILSLLAAHEQPFMDEPLSVEWTTAAEAVPARPDGGAKLYCVKCQTTLSSESANFCPKCGHKRPSRGWPLDRLLGQTVAGGQYRVIRRLGSGGFGVVYEVETSVGGLRRALKVLKEDWAHEESIRERFINEAVALERINHPNVARCFAAGTLDQNGDLYLLFELIDGTPLSALIGSGGDAQARLEPLRAVRIARQVAAGLAAAHAKHILHRDLKPANVMILESGTTAERVKLLDFGIAKFVEGDATWTAGLIGTPAFMAPEQFSPEAEISPRVDLWQLGALLFSMLTGRPPYTPDDLSSHPLGSFHRKAGEPGPSPSEIERSIAAHPALDRFVGRLLATDPAERPATATEVCQELALIEQSMSPLRTSGQTALLDALCSKPSRDSWLALCRYLEDQDPDVRDSAENRLSSWPTELRRAPIAWWERALKSERPALWHLTRSLDLSGRGLTDEEVKRIAECPALECIRKLNLAHNSIGPEGMAALSRSRYVTKLEWLDLSNNRIGNQGVESLARSPNLQQLRFLTLTANRIAPRALENLIECSLPLEHLDLSDNDLGAGGAEVLARTRWDRLQSLRLGNNRLGADGIAVLSVSPLFSKLQELDLRRNAAGPAGVAALALSRNLGELRRLVLSKNGLGREGLQLLLSSAGLDALETLDISSNGVGANGAMALASSLLARRIRVLDLADNQIGDTGVAALVGAPQLTGLSSLDISQNDITPSGIALFDGSALQLDCLNLSSNSLAGRGAELLSLTIGPLRVRKLIIRRNNLGAEDFGLIVRGAKGNLIELDVSDNKLEGRQCQVFTQHPELTSLRSLALNGSGAGPDEVLALFSSPYLLSLEELALNSNRLGDDGIVRLSGISALARLSRLSLQDNGIGYQGVAALAASPLSTHLTELDLSFNQLGDAGAEAVATGSTWHQLQELRLRTNGVGFSGMAALLSGKGLGMLQVLDLADNPLLGELDLYSLGQDTLSLVESSFAHVSGMGKQLAERFYVRMFERFPEVKPLFAHVSMSRQQQHLFSALVMIIENLRSPDTLRASLENLSRRHIGYGVRPGHYAAFSTVLLQALEELSQEEWSPAVHDAWSEALEAITRVMLDAHRQTKAE